MVIILLLSDAQMIEIKTFKGAEILSFIDDIGKLRIENFREYPYLYIGNLDDERGYLSAYANDSHALLAVAFHEEKIIGLSTGIPVYSKSSVVSDLKEKYLYSGHNVNSC